MTQDLPAIPAKRYFTIGEVSQLCGVRSYVLRYWEQEFDQLRPMKRRGNRRYYQHHEVVLVRKIRQLLYEQGYTIQGARQQLDAKHVVVGVVDEVESFQLLDNATELDVHDDNSFAFEDDGPVESNVELESIVLALEEAKANPVPSSKIFGLDAVINELKAIRALLIGSIDK
ncbi:MerR family transcriptional regulator [Ephemeroptericola cinctiostellae]|uniref:MerR family transcriptional regulator n=1 Tax=Ephemeroptericola cinctiostellae TaxID=2268024 RepID=UPI000DF82BBD|nr:MerR family transcriptional regulator [Ephemeroptericola cinctiostellae]